MLNWFTTPGLNKNQKHSFTNILLHNLVPKRADWKKLLTLVRDGAANKSWCWGLMQRQYLQVDRQRTLSDPVGCHKLEAMAAEPQTLEDLWSHGDVVGDVPSGDRQSGQQRLTSLDCVRHTWTFKNKQTVSSAWPIGAETQQNAWPARPDLQKGQDGLWVNCSFHRKPTCIYADLHLQWFSKQNVTARCNQRRFASVTGDGAELCGRFLNDNDSPGWGLRVGAGAISRQGESARMTVLVRHVAGRSNRRQHVVTSSSSGAQRVIFVLPLSPITFCNVCHKYVKKLARSVFRRIVFQNVAMTICLCCQNQSLSQCWRFLQRLKFQFEVR